MKTKKTQKLDVTNRSVGNSGIFHAIVEALTVALQEKSWDNIIYVGVDNQTHEGIVKYEDSVFSDDRVQRCEIRSHPYIHICSKSNAGKKLS